MRTMHTHAGMDPDQRAKVMRDWAEGSIDIVVATIAFGGYRFVM